jgi:hypothetical protein
VELITVADVLRENVVGSEIEWPVVGHSRDKKKIKGCFERLRLCALRVAGRV